MAWINMVNAMPSPSNLETEFHFNDISNFMNIFFGGKFTNICGHDRIKKSEIEKFVLRC